MPVCLPIDDSDPSGKTGIAVGWGRTSEGGALPGKTSLTNFNRNIPFKSIHFFEFIHLIPVDINAIYNS